MTSRTKIDNSSFEKVEQFTYLGTTLLNYLLTYVLTYLLTHLLTHSLTHSLAHSLTRSLAHSLTACSTVLLEKLTVPQPVKFPAFYGTEGSLPHSQVLATCPYPEPDQSSLCCLYSSRNIIRVIKLRRMRWAVHVARIGERKDVYRVFVGKPEGKRPFGRPKCRWEDNVKMDLQEVG